MKLGGPQRLLGGPQRPPFNRLSLLQRPVVHLNWVAPGTCVQSCGATQFAAMMAVTVSAWIHQMDQMVAQM